LFLASTTRHEARVTELEGYRAKQGRKAGRQEEDRQTLVPNPIKQMQLEFANRQKECVKRPGLGDFAGAGAGAGTGTGTGTARFFSHRRLIVVGRSTHVPKSYLFQVKGILNYTGGGHSHAKNVLFCGEVVWCRDSIYLH